MNSSALFSRRSQHRSQHRPRSDRVRLALALALVIGCVELNADPPASVVAGAQYRLLKSTIDSGGGKMIGGRYSLNGTVGQLDAHQALSGGRFGLQPGFWAETEPVLVGEQLFRDGFEQR